MAQINILATADNHGRIDRMPHFFESVENNLPEIFPKKEDSTDVLMIAGDWFINPAQMPFITKSNLLNLGFGTDREPTAGHYNLMFLNRFCEELNKKSHTDFQSVYLIGNHCLDNSDGYLLDLLEYRHSKISCLSTNVDFEKSSETCKKTINETIVLTTPSQNHKALVIGITPTNYRIENRLTDGRIIFMEGSLKTPDRLNPDTDLILTFKKLINHIETFKTKHPDDAVIVLNHMGNPVAEKIVEKLDLYNKETNQNLKIDLILNGHDHKDQKIFIGENSTPIVSLGENNEKFEAIKVIFDNNEVKVEISETFTINDQLEKENIFSKMLQSKMAEDYDPKTFISVVNTNNTINNLTMLSYKGAKYENNYLANFLTDAILEEIRKSKPECNIFGISPVYIRGSLSVNTQGINNFDIINLFTATDRRFRVFSADIKGEDIVKLIAETAIDNRKNIERYSLMQWAGLKINKNAIWEEFDKYKEPLTMQNIMHIVPIENLKPHIMIKYDDSNYENIDISKYYHTAIASYPLHSNKFPTLMSISNEFKEIDSNKTAKSMFYDYLSNKNNKITLYDIHKDIRI